MLLSPNVTLPEPLNVKTITHVFQINTRKKIKGTLVPPLIKRDSLGAKKIGKILIAMCQLKTTACLPKRE